MQEVDRVWQDASRHEVDEDGQDLARRVSREEERGQVGEGHDGDGVEDQKLPYTLIFQVESCIHADYQQHGNVHFEDICDQMARPVGSQAHT